MGTSALILVLLAATASNIGGMIALKYAAAGHQAVWAVLGAACWTLTAALTLLALQERPLVFVSLISTGLSVISAILVGHLIYGEALRPLHLAAIALLAAALILNAVAGR